MSQHSPQFIKMRSIAQSHNDEVQVLESNDPYLNYLNQAIHYYVAQRTRYLDLLKQRRSKTQETHARQHKIGLLGEAYARSDLFGKRPNLQLVPSERSRNEEG
jgi:hypothetical protein